MRIGIDARFLTHPQAGGFKTYTQNLVAALPGVDGENEYFLYLDRQPEEDAPVPRSLKDCPNITFRTLPGTAPMVGMIWREQVSLARQAQLDRVDLLHAPALTAPLRFNRPLVVTLHDMIWRFPEKYSRPGKKSPRSLKRSLMEAYYRYIPERAAQNAAALITVSEASKRSILEHLPVDPRKVYVTPEAAGDGFCRIDNPAAIEDLRRQRNLPDAYILAIGSADPRKNLISLVRAYASLPNSLRDRFSLVIVWTHTHLAAELMQELKPLRIEDDVHFLTSVSNHELALLYSGAALFVFPSLYEGFGLPLLEAMACGAPVAAANNSSIPEIVGRAGRLFNERDPNDIARVLAGLLEDGPARAALSRAGLERAAGFSWERCARETAAVYRKVAAS